MTTALVITSSLAGPQSESTRLLERYVARLARLEPALTVLRRDLGREPVAPLDGTRLRALGRPAAERTPEEALAIAESDRLIAELRAADVVLLAAPMYNFGVPSGLKSWFDAVARAGVTFRYTAAGPQGLLSGRRAVLVTTRGGRHRGTAADHVVPYVRTMLAFIGITDLEVVYAEGLAIGPAERAAALATAEAEIDAMPGRRIAA